MDPDAERQFKLSHSIDGSQFAQALAATCTEEERTFADEVPSVCRVHIRQEILSADYEDDAAETTEAHRRRLTEQQPSQSFQIFHPEAAKALRIQSEALQGLASADLKAERAQAEEAERQEKADQGSQLQAAVLAPIQEGMQSVPLLSDCLPGLAPPDPTDMLQHYLPAMRALQNGHNPWAANPKLLEEMPDLKHTRGWSHAPPPETSAWNWWAR